MANVDRPNGFRPVKTLSGRPWNAMIRSIGVADGGDIFIGDALNLESGLAAQAATNDANILGVAVGFGKKNEMSQDEGGMFNPDNLEKRFYDDSESTNTDWVVYYVPAEDVIFEIQVDDTADTLVVGETIDFQVGTGSSTTSRSAMEINGGTATNADLTVVEIPKYVDNDPTAAFGRYWVMFTRAEQAFHA